MFFESNELMSIHKFTAKLRNNPKMAWLSTLKFKIISGFL